MKKTFCSMVTFFHENMRFICSAPFIVTFVAMLSFYAPVGAKTTVSIQLLDYSNPTSLDYSGSCCDCCGGLGYCPNDCENLFVFYVAPYPLSSSSVSSAWIRWETYVLGDDSFNFPGSGQALGSGLTNPLTYLFSGSWPGAFGIILKVWDDDSGHLFGVGHEDDLVDEIRYNIPSISAQKDLQSATARSITLSGRRSNTRIQVRVYCDANYYGADCNTYCVERDDSGGHYWCDVNTGNKICLAGWTGQNCRTAINLCATNPCQNSGTCVNFRTYYTCTCRAGFEGANCQTDIVECNQNKCQNGATCKDIINDYRCDCVAGFTGRDCDVDIYECQPNPCHNNGTCIDEINGYRCDCLQGFSGVNCSTNIDDCQGSPCENNGTCVDLVNDYMCNCLLGFTGVNCSANIDDCQLADTCDNNGTCVDEINGYRCNCPLGFTGINCSTNIDDCQSDPCDNNGTCIDEINRYRCNCLLGFTGINCSTNIDDCQSDPCENNGICFDEINGYRCSCLRGFGGVNCLTNIDDCQAAPCENDGTCIDEVNGYRCSCTEGFSGVNCSTNINDCTPSTCNNEVDKPQDEEKNKPVGNTTPRNIGIAAACVVVGMAVGVVLMWICMKRKIKKKDNLRAGFDGTVEYVPGKDNYMNPSYASVGARNPSCASVGDVTPGYTTTKNLEKGVNPSPERCVDGAATWKSVDTLGKNQHLTRATRKDVGPAARRSENHHNAFEMGVFNAEEPKEDEEHVYSEIPYGLNPH